MSIKLESPCVVCCKMTKSYSCPKCRSAYCSVGCCKQHKVDGCQSISTIEQSAISSVTPYERKSDSLSEIPEKDRLSEEVLNKLSQFHVSSIRFDQSTILILGSPEIIDLLKSSQLRSALKSLDSAHNPGPILKKLMADPEFESFAQVSLKLVDPNSAVEPVKSISEMCDKEVLEIFQDRLQSEFQTLYQ